MVSSPISSDNCFRYEYKDCSLSVAVNIQDARYSYMNIDYTEGDILSLEEIDPFIKEYIERMIEISNK